MRGTARHQKHGCNNRSGKYGSGEFAEHEASTKTLIRIADSLGTDAGSVTHKRLYLPANGRCNFLAAFMSSGQNSSARLLVAKPLRAKALRLKPCDALA